MEKTLDLQNTRGDMESEIVDRHREEWPSGKDLDCPDFKRMMRDIQERRVDTVILKGPWRRNEDPVWQERGHQLDCQNGRS